MKLIIMMYALIFQILLWNNLFYLCIFVILATTASTRCRCASVKIRIHVSDTLRRLTQYVLKLRWRPSRFNWYLVLRSKIYMLCKHGLTSMMSSALIWIHIQLNSLVFLHFFILIIFHNLYAIIEHFLFISFK